MEEYCVSIFNREIQWLKAFAKPRSKEDPLRQVESQENPRGHIDLLERCIKVIAHLHPPSQSTAAVIWNNDVSLQNIMITNGEHPRIVSLIDWQNTCISPLYLAFCEPTFLRRDYIESPSDAASEIYKIPFLESETRQNTVSLRDVYLQVLCQSVPNLRSLIGIPYAETQKMLMLKAARSWSTRKGIISLRQGLINFWRNWNEYGLDGIPPISFTQQEIDLHLEEGDGMNGQLDFIWTIIQAIGMSQTGEVDACEYEAKKRRYEEVKQKWIEDMDETVRKAGSADTIDWAVHWPFRYPQLGF
jgi:hypothetical protein